MAALVALRARALGADFQLFSNVDAARPLDDLVLRVAGPAAALYFVQIKHSADRRPLHTQALAGKAGDFSLAKYFRFYESFREKHQRRDALKDADERWLTQGRLQDARFLILTTKDMRSRSSAEQRDVPHEDLFLTGRGHVVSFGREDPEVWDLFKGDPREHIYQSEFLPRLSLLVGQSPADELDYHILVEMKKTLKDIPASRNIATNYTRLFKTWFEDANRSYCVTPRSPELALAVAVHLRDSARASACSHKLVFQDEHCAELREALGRQGQLRVRVAGTQTGPRSAKVLQLLESGFQTAGRWTLVDRDALRDFPVGLLAAAAATGHVLVVDPRDAVDAAQALVREVGAAVRLVVEVCTAGSILRALTSSAAPSVQDEWRLSHLTASAQGRMLDEIVVFQGEAMPLRNLERSWPSLKDHVDGALLGELALGGRPVLGAPPPEASETPNLYIERAIQHASALDPAVLHSLDPQRDHLVLSGFPQRSLFAVAKRLGVLLPHRNERWTALESVMRDLQVGDCHIGPQEAFRRVAQRQREQGRRSVHWVACVHDADGDLDKMALVWRRSSGSADALAPWVRPATPHCARQPTCVHAPTATNEEVVRTAAAWGARAALLVGEAGAGKSSFLRRVTSALVKRHPTHWAVFVPVLEHRQLLEQMPKAEEISVEHLKELLAAAAGVTKSPGELFLIEALLVTGAVSVLVDGVDELCPFYTEKILGLLDLLLRETEVALLWVSTRPEISTSLCGTLRCSPVSLQLIKYKEQIQYLHNYWTSKNKSGTEGIAKKLVDALPRTFSQEDNDDSDDFDGDDIAESNLLAVPLHLRMAAEIFNEKMDREEGNRILSEHSKINIFDLYRQFIELKQKEYQHKHFEGANIENIPYEDSKFLLLHQNCAMLQLVEDKEFDGVDGRAFAERTQENKETLRREKTGILWMEEGGGPRFVHFSFLEFFAASWLRDNLSTAAAEAVVRAVYGTGVRRGVRHFLEWMLAEDCPLHGAILAGDQSLEGLLQADALVDQRDQGGRSALHLAAAYHQRDVARELIARRCQLDLRDALLGWTPLQYLETVLNGHPRGERGRADSAWEPTQESTEDVDMWDALFVAELLLEAGAEKTHLAALVHDQRRVIQAAAKLELPHVMDLLLEHGITVSNYMLALNLAEDGKKLELLQRLLKYQFDNCRNGRFITATKDENSSKQPRGAPEILPSLRDSQTTYSLVLKIHDSEEESYQPFEYSTGIPKDNSSLQILSSAFEGDVQFLKDLVKNATVANAKNERGVTALHFAACKGHHECAMHLINQGASVNAEDDSGFTPLHLSAKQGHLKVVESLMSAGANVKAKSAQGVTPLHLAVLNHHDDCVRHFRQVVNEPEKNGFTPLHFAVHEGHLPTVKTLLQFGADCNNKTKDGSTGIHLAVLRGNMQCIQILLDRKRGDRKFINEPDKYGFFPLHLASGKGHIEIMQKLLESGGRVNIRSKNAGTPLHFAIMSGSEKCVEWLIEQRAELNDEYIEGLTPVQLAMRLKLPKILAKLSGAGADPNKKNHQGQTLLYLASLQGDKESVESLLQRGANPNDRSYDKSTPLHAAAMNGYIEVVRLLLKFGANVSHENNHGNTPLVVAANAGHQDCVQTLRRAALKRSRRTIFDLNTTWVEAGKSTQAEASDAVGSESSYETSHKSVSQLLTHYEKLRFSQIKPPSTRIVKAETHDRRRDDEVSQAPVLPSQTVPKKEVASQDMPYNNYRENHHKSKVSQLREYFEKPPETSTTKIGKDLTKSPSQGRKAVKNPEGHSTFDTPLRPKGSPTNVEEHVAGNISSFDTPQSSNIRAVLLQDGLGRESEC